MQQQKSAGTNIDLVMLLLPFWLRELRARRKGDSGRRERQTSLLRPFTTSFVPCFDTEIRGHRTPTRAKQSGAPSDLHIRTRSDQNTTAEPEARCNSRPDVRARHRSRGRVRSAE